MNLNRLIPFRTHKKLYPLKSPVKSLHTGKGIFYTGEDLYSNEFYKFSLRLIRLYDEAMMTGNLYVLSIEQERLLEKYFLEGNTITPPDSLIDLSGWVYDFDSLSSDINQLDEFLGSYVGDNYGRKC